MVTVRIDSEESHYRIAKFYITGLENYVVSVSQWKSYVTLKMESPYIDGNSYDYGVSDTARMHAQAMLQAADLMDEWWKDTGKEIE